MLYNLACNVINKLGYMHKDLITKDDPFLVEIVRIFTVLSQEKLTCEHAYNYYTAKKVKHDRENFIHETVYN